MQKLQKASKMKITFSNVVTLDQDMTGSTMGCSVVKKINNVLKVLFRNSKYFFKFQKP